MINILFKTRRWTFGQLLSSCAAIGALAGVLLSGAGAQAAPLSYTEAQGGDLAEFWNQTQVLNLDAGANTVSGSQFFDARNPQQLKYDFDSFRFVVPQGMQLVSVSLSTQITDAFGALANALYVDTYIDTVPGLSVVAHEQIAIKTPGQPVAGGFNATMPLGGGTYLWFQGQLGGLLGGEAAFWDYTWTLNVRPMANAAPEPGSIALAAAAMAALAAARRRRRV